MTRGVNPPPGHNALLCFEVARDLLYIMPSRTDTAGHTRAFDYPVMDHCASHRGCPGPPREPPRLPRSTTRATAAAPVHHASHRGCPGPPREPPRLPRSTTLATAAAPVHHASHRGCPGPLREPPRLPRSTARATAAAPEDQIYPGSSTEGMGGGGLLPMGGGVTCENSPATCRPCLGGGRIV